MTKTKGFKLRIDAFLPIDKKDFAKQSAAYATLATIKHTGKLPDGFLDQVTILGIEAKEGSAELPDAAQTEPEVPTDEPEIPGTAEAATANGRRHKANPDETSE